MYFCVIQNKLTMAIINKITRRQLKKTHGDHLVVILKIKDSDKHKEDFMIQKVFNEKKEQYGIDFKEYSYKTGLNGDDFIHQQYTVLMKIKI